MPIPPAAALGGHERVALVADARASLPDLPGPRDVIRVDVTRRDGVPFTVLVPYVREGQAVRLLPGVMEVAAPRTGADAALPPDGRDGMRE